MTVGFGDARFLSAEEKRLVLKAWERFLRRGLRWTDFSRRLYGHLIQHCSFIAHYDRRGFYAVYFEDPEATVRFVGQFDPDGPGRSVEYGTTYWWEGHPANANEYADVNLAMREAIRPFLARIRESATARARERDLARADLLRRKWGMA